MWIVWSVIGIIIAVILIFLYAMMVAAGRNDPEKHTTGQCVLCGRPAVPGSWICRECDHRILDGEELADDDKDQRQEPAR